MKILAIWDIHWLDTRRKAVDDNDCDVVVFIGDYFDTFHEISYSDQIANFEAIMDYKLNSWKVVHVLIGNHDFHYINKSWEKYSWYQRWPAYIIKEAIMRYYNKLEICCQYGDVIFSHAGFTNMWVKNNMWVFNVEQANKLFLKHEEVFWFSQQDSSMKWDSIYQWPLRVRPGSLVSNRLPGFRQVVWHTHMPHITNIDWLYFIDTLEHGKRLELEVEMI